jgi:hypothetical protein
MVVVALFIKRGESLFHKTEAPPGAKEYEGSTTIDAPTYQ